MSESPIQRPVFIVSDGTGITAETFSHSVLSQFSADFDFTLLREPFITSEEKAVKVAEKINATALEENTPPILFSTLVKPEILSVVQQSNCIFLDIFGACVNQLEAALETKSRPTIGLSHLSASSKQYRNRIEAINFTLAHDDGQFVHGLKEADVILVGVSRCGKTPTSLYLAMQYAIKAANFPLIPEDFERGSLPSTLHPYRNKLFGLSIQPDRLSEVRNERRPDSKYASIKQCLYEVAEAERLMRVESIEWLSTTTKSIEEISTTVIQILGLKSHSSSTY